VWVTNNPAIHNFVKHNLFPRWGVKYVATQHWLKLTVYGEPVMPLDFAHRKPYESFVVGCFCPSGPGLSMRGTDVADKLARLREEMVICSVANRFARKPSLDDMLGLGANSGLKRLELFARNLRPGWTSWGNQVLLFQEIKYFIEKKTGSDRAEQGEQ
jgi:N6-adenosine-specific RNA methylase IME4